MNHLDLFMSRGLAGIEFLIVPGGDVAGEVVAVGPGGQRSTHGGAGNHLPSAHLWPVSVVPGRRGQFLPEVAAIGPGSERWVR